MIPEFDRKLVTPPIPSLRNRLLFGDQERISKSQRNAALRLQVHAGRNADADLNRTRHVVVTMKIEIDMRKPCRCQCGEGAALAGNAQELSAGQPIMRLWI